MTESTLGRSLRSQAKRLIVRKRFEEACEVLTEGIERFPQSYKFYRLRSLAYACLQKYRECCDDADRLIALRPEYPHGYYYKGDYVAWLSEIELRSGFCCYHEGEYLAAAAEFAKGMKRTPADMVMKQAFWDAVTSVSHCAGTSVP